MLYSSTSPDQFTKYLWYTDVHRILRKLSGDRTNPRVPGRLPGGGNVLTPLEEWNKSPRYTHKGRSLLTEGKTWAGTQILKEKFVPCDCNEGGQRWWLGGPEKGQKCPGGPAHPTEERSEGARGLTESGLQAACLELMLALEALALGLLTSILFSEVSCPPFPKLL